MGKIFSQPEDSRQSVLAYKNFLRLYKRQHSEMPPNEAMMNAARVWATFSQTRRMRYAQVRCSISDMLLGVSKQLASKTDKKRQRKASSTKRRTKVRKSSENQSCDEIELFQPQSAITISETGIPGTQSRTAFSNFMDFYQGNHSNMSRSSALKHAAVAWCDMPRDQRKLFSEL
ncbi:uncharacterized protein LOC108096026 [Drosophila ficusphila]|uniref:uncharacterized protein LOC108096026 n=1 Tax=Drosophila ficusphila TaxID=30025 RepID=UPI0007E78BD5|nr:uncharacterized protein LOC108096026 [Drosophila ficusphila]